eukprot:Skav230235  [mRNA]  locus=scaffold4204:157597:157929:- [translate_table: standard]
MHATRENTLHTVGRVWGAWRVPFWSWELEANPLLCSVDDKETMRQRAPWAPECDEHFWTTCAYHSASYKSKQKGKLKLFRFSNCESLMLFHCMEGRPFEVLSDLSANCLR